MSDSQTSVDWRDLKEFAGVRLDKSYVLSWHVESEQLQIDVDLHLTKDHPQFEQPRPAEKVCIRPAIIEFPYCDEILIDGEDVGSVSTAAEQIRHGSIKGLRRVSGNAYEIEGDFGVVKILAERPIIRIKAP